MSDNVAITAGAGTNVATDEIGGVHYQKVKLAFGLADAATLVSSADPLPVAGAVTVSGTVPVSGTFFQATQPVSIAATVAVSGPLTDTQLRAAAVPVSAASLPLPAGASTSAKQPALGTAGSAATDVLTVQGIASMTALKVDGSAVTQPISGTITANLGTIAGVATETTLAAMNTKTPALGQATMANSSPVAIASNQSAIPVSGTFWQTTQPVSGTVIANAGTGTMAVSIATLPALAAGTNNIGDVDVLSLPALPAGTNNIGDVDVLTLPALPAGTALIGKVGIDQTTPGTTNAVVATGPTLTKATQAATGFSVQDLKDAGRTSFGAATVIGGVTAVSTEALLSLVPVRAGTAGAGATSIAVTAAKRLRITAIIASVRSSAATVISARVALRMNPSGAVTATSPIIAILSMTQQAAALAEAGDTCVFTIPDGIEFSGTEQIGLTQVCSGTGGVVYASIVGFEY